MLRAHTPLTDLFSCLWFNENVRFSPRDQLSFALVRDRLLTSIARSMSAHARRGEDEQAFTGVGDTGGAAVPQNQLTSSVLMLVRNRLWSLIATSSNNMSEDVRSVNSGGQSGSRGDKPLRRSPGWQIGMFLDCERRDFSARHVHVWKEELWRRQWREKRRKTKGEQKERGRRRNRRYVSINISTLIPGATEDMFRGEEDEEGDAEVEGR